MTGPAPVGCGDEVYQPQAVLAAAPDAYVAIDAAGHVVGWNPAAEITFGHHHGQACGRDLAELVIPARYRQAHRDGLARLAAGRAGYWGSGCRWKRCTPTATSSRWS
jgi:PAS domain S-box-containing protein